MVIDIGTGSGQAVLRRARREPGSLVIGVDTDARAMAESSRRAAANARRGGVPNALFLAESAERLPGPLAGVADMVTVVLPWGSLLLGLLAEDGATLTALTACLKPHGDLRLLLSDLTEAQVQELVMRYQSAGVSLIDASQATTAGTAELSSGWARRLGIPGSRPAWIIRLWRGDHAKVSEVGNAHGVDRAQHRG